nr:MAG TPA: hypothetical protein [Caudoviricetes sp.]
MAAEGGRVTKVTRTRLTPPTKNKRRKSNGKNESF